MLLLALWGALAVQPGGIKSVDPADSLWLIAAVWVITIPIFARMGCTECDSLPGRTGDIRRRQAVLLSALVLDAWILIADVQNVSISAAFAYFFYRSPAHWW